MRTIFPASAGLGLACLAVLATPAAAQTLEQQLAYCASAPGHRPIALGGPPQEVEIGRVAGAEAARDPARSAGSAADLVIGGCTWVIQFGHQSAAGTSVAYNNRGLAHINQWDFTRALADYSEAIRLNPQFADAYNNRGFIYGVRGDHTRAIVDFNEAIRLNPQFRDVYLNRGHAYEMLGDHARAAADRAEAARLSATGH